MKFAWTIIMTAICLPLYACAGGGNSVANVVRTDIEGLGYYIQMPFAVNSATYELVVSPHPGGIPGPTDWAGVVAIIAIENAALKELERTLPTTEDCWLMAREFWRPWYGIYLEEIKELGNSVEDGERVCYDADSLSERNSFRSFIAPLDDSRVFFYVEYRNPG